jgi:hypothetical protein
MQTSFRQGLLITWEIAPGCFLSGRNSGSLSRRRGTVHLTVRRKHESIDLLRLPSEGHYETWKATLALVGSGTGSARILPKLTGGSMIQMQLSVYTEIKSTNLLVPMR